MATHSSILAWKIPRTEEPVDYSPGGPKELDTTERLTLSLSFLSISQSCGAPGVVRCFFCKFWKAIQIQLGNDLIGKQRTKDSRFDWNHRGAAQRLGSLLQRLKENTYMLPWLYSWLLPLGQRASWRKGG